MTNQCAIFAKTIPTSRLSNVLIVGKSFAALTFRRMNALKSNLI